ncbi:MAG TPA: hypothetical protein VE913_11120 [Longimicrobium sp.]|nr:hypothetical protein [Longimicrobium sp.]
MRKIVFAALFGVLALAAAEPARAQVFTPTFQAPVRGNDIGVYLSDFGGDLAIEGIARRGLGGYDLGLRLGIADEAVLVGLDSRSPLRLAGTTPLDLALTFGGQGALGGDANAFGAQVGVSIGHTFAAPELSITPYIHPRASVFFGDATDEGFHPQADVGLDVAFRSNLILRFGANLADEGADWGLGLSFRR